MLSFSASIPQATAAGDYTVCYYDYEIEQTVSLPVNIGLRGDANGDKKVNAADLVEMVNAKKGKASAKFTKKCLMPRREDLSSSLATSERYPYSVMPTRVVSIWTTCLRACRIS